MILYYQKLKMDFEEKVISADSWLCLVLTIPKTSKWGLFLLHPMVKYRLINVDKRCPLPVTSKSKMERRLKKAEYKIDKLAELIHQQRVYMEGANIHGKLLGIIQRFIAKKFGPHAYRGFFTDDNCTNCG